MKLKTALFLIFLPFIASMALYFSGINPHLIQSEDTLPAMFLPLSILKEGTIFLDSYYEMLVNEYPHPDDKKRFLGLTPFYLRKSDNHYLSAFPLMSGLLALPIYVLPVLFNVELSWLNIALLAKLSGSVIVGLSAIFIFKVSRKYVDDKKALIVTFAYAFGTINFASMSQALWQHGTLEFFSALCVLFLIQAERLKANVPTWKLFFSGLFIGFAVISRPTAVLPLVLLSIYVFQVFRFQGFLRFLLPVLVPGALFFTYNSFFYKSISNQGYASQVFDSWLTPVYLGFSGIWLSPSKGLLIYSPIFFFALLGAFIVWRRFLKSDSLKSEVLLFRYFSLIVLGHTVVIAMWKHWYGGWSFGYRMASDIIPYLVLLLIPYLKSPLYEKTKMWFYAAFAWSVGIELMGLAFFDGIWHGTFDKGFRDQRWLWSLQNSEIVFNIRRVLQKF